jgi:pre-mRNA-splicing factor CWC26
MNEKLPDQSQETIYRDKRGRKLDMLTEFMRQQEVVEGKKQKIEEAQYEWGKGAVQKQAAVDAVKELEEIAQEPFARTIDDPKLEKIKKSQIRDGDPMAEYFMKKVEKSQIDPELGVRTSRTGKPLYSGPNPTPNRFALRPGYRWDAVDRGNGFEHRILTKQSEKMSYKDEEYKYSVSDL